MASVAVRGSQRIIVVNVALRAGRGGVNPSECEPRRGMIEARNIGPGDGVMTRRTVCRGEGRPRRRVSRIVGLLPRRKMAAGIGTIGGRDIQRVVVVDVALRAVGNFAGRSKLVRVGEGESGGGVVEGGIGPRRGVVAL